MTPSHKLPAWSELEAMHTRDACRILSPASERGPDNFPRKVKLQMLTKDIFLGTSKNLYDSLDQNLADLWNLHHNKSKIIDKCNVQSINRCITVKQFWLCPNSVIVLCERKQINFVILDLKLSFRYPKLHFQV